MQLLPATSNRLLRRNCCRSNCCRSNCCRSNMLLGLSLRVSWICLLLFSSAACRPMNTEDYRLQVPWGSSGGSAPGSNLQSEGSRPPLVHAAAPQQASAPSGHQSPSSVGAPSVAAASSPSYEPNKFVVTYDSSPNKPSRARVPSQSAGYVSPPVGPPPPVRPQPVGSDVAASSPTYGFFQSPGFAYPVENKAAGWDSGAGSGPYPAAPASYDIGAGSGPYDAPASYDIGPASYAGYPYGNPSSAGSLWYEQPSGGADASFDLSSLMLSRSFPDFSVWDSDDEMPESASASETSPLPPSSYIIQSRNGYQRAREFLSHSKYSPEYPEPPPFSAYQAVKAPSKSPMTGSSGGQKV